jgi:NTP pyrophosphatase (non-canonical NTP hydrolase)
VIDAEKAANELADVIVTACCLAHALGIDDIMAIAAEKAVQDLKRGRRGENDKP